LADDSGCEVAVGEDGVEVVSNHADAAAGPSVSSGATDADRTVEGGATGEAGAGTNGDATKAAAAAD